MLSLKDYEMLDKKPQMDYGKQALIQCGDYTLSVITGPGAYGGGQGKYEIAIFNSQGIMTKLPGIHDDYKDKYCDDVIGYLSESDVDLIILKLYYASGGVCPYQVKQQAEATA